MIQIEHNFDPTQFMWLWAKYVTGFNGAYHCTNSIPGRYSKVFSKHNPDLPGQTTILFDEQPEGSYEAIYVCGVAKAGYSSRRNYPHNVHAAIEPVTGHEEGWRFENWTMRVRGGRFLPIPGSPDAIPARYQALPSEYVTCRIFRWAACFFDQPLA